MNEIILLKLGELVLKGLNRRTFEDRLVANARRRLQAHGKFKVYTKQSTMYVEPQSEDCDLDGAWEAMTKLFGVVGLSRARACAKDKDAMLQTAVEYLGDRLAAAKTFKVESKRADKNFPMTSIQLSQYVGGELDEKYPNLTVANVFMLYTGAPQNTRRKEISELNIDAGWEYAHAHGIDEIVVHAPYIINLANTVKPETYELAVEFLEKEIIRTAAMRCHILVLHP